MPKTKKQREAAEQAMVVDWFYFSFPKEVLIVSANGGKRDIGTAIQLKRSGVRRGVPDLFVPKVNETAGGLWIEFKPSILPGEPKPRVTPEQVWMLKHLNSRGYIAKVCFGFEEATFSIRNYLMLG